MFYPKDTTPPVPIAVSTEVATDGTFRIFFDDIYIGFFQTDGSFLRINLNETKAQLLQEKGIRIGPDNHIRAYE